MTITKPTDHIEFTLNYSPQAADLLRAGQIAFDRFKCPDWPELIEPARALRPVYVHFPLRASNHLIAGVDLERVAAMRADTETPHVNIHLAPYMRDFAAEFGSFDPYNLTEAQRETIITRMTADVQRLAQRFGPEHVLVENVPYRNDPTHHPKLTIEPQVIRRVLAETGCRFLLDTAHAAITAWSLGIPVTEYIAELPLDRLGELHVTGVQWHEGRLMDHLALTDDDWPIVAWTLDQIRGGRAARPWAISCEYGGVTEVFNWRSDAGVIAEQIPRLAALIKPLQMQPTE
ncbi:MAG: DUF692 family protein [Chloroflexi bacterium]|nr:DUF692 family protein [Chloroflexota bacterium]